MTYISGASDSCNLECIGGSDCACSTIMKEWLVTASLVTLTGC